MFEGEFSHSLDDKGRIIFPMKFRTRLGERPIITRGLGGCLYVFTEDHWHTIKQKLSEPAALNQDAILLQRFLAGSATELNVDPQGRVAIPQNLRNFAGITQNVTVVGLSDKIEIWDTTRYEEMMANLTTEQIAASARMIGLA